ncbi:DNA polymerase III subunit delta' [Niveibacterium sp. SC-1]|uniref:DNA polymerase III subunit delta' n=1 Tax=Niveibacterium sp. SC-1 TaxID=3135646 RepID=UPI00311E8903
MILPWHEALWRRLQASGERAHHALLLAGPAGGGKRLFAEAAAAARLCDRPDSTGKACGACESCTWLAAGTHPDFFRVVPEADEANEDADADKDTAKSRQIRVDQVRRLQESLEKKGHRGGRRAVLVDPAEAMNVITANGLLKLLEEPPAGVLFLLVSGAIDRLLPTLLSRCQRWDFTAPEAADALGWLKSEGVPQPDTWLAFAGGMPLAAREAAQGPLAALRQRFVRDMASLSSKDPLSLAAEWDQWLRSKDAQSAGLDMPRLADWMLRWQADLAARMQSGVPRFFPDARAEFESLHGRVSARAALACYNDGLKLKQVAAHPLNARLLLEDSLLRYSRHIAPTRVPGR